LTLLTLVALLITNSVHTALQYTHFLSTQYKVQALQTDKNWCSILWKQWCCLWCEQSGLPQCCHSIM